MNQIRTALCSYGMSGKLFHAPFLHVHPGFDLYAVWERSKSVVQQDYPNTKSFADYDQLLKDHNIDLVIVNTPNYTHFEFAKKALLAGKHVIVEKPFTVTVAEGNELIELAAKTNKVLSVYQNRRYDSDYKTVRQIIRDECLGEIVEAEFHYDRYKEDLSPKIHKETPGPGTGALYDLGSHLIDQALQLFGMPTAVFADIHTIRPISQVDDYFEVLLYYPRLRVRLRSSYLVREPIPGYVVHGTRGSFIKHKTDVQEQDLLEGKLPIGEDWGKEPQDQKGLLHTVRNGEIIREYITSFQGNYMVYFDAIYESIRKSTLPPVLAEEGLNVIRIIEAAFKSQTEGRVVEI